MRARPPAFGAIAFALFAVLAVTPVHPQMDMLPQIFRDLPPEMQQGLPHDMTHEEYRQLTRNVDFFTMFMSMFIPGYAMFQVERPALGWTIAGTRIAGTGLMVAAIVRQWNDWQDLRDLDNLEPPSYRRFRNNAFLFAGGVFVNAVAWAADVAGAYRIANEDRNFVIYKYGLRRGLEPGDEHAEIEYIRGLLLQDSDSEARVRGELGQALARYAALFPSGEYRAEVEYYRGSLAFRTGEPARALLHLSRQIYFFPDHRFTPQSQHLAARIVAAERTRWPDDWALLLEMFGAEEVVFAGRTGEAIAGATDPEGAEYAERVRDYLEKFAELRDPEFADLYIEEVLDIARRSAGSAYADSALYHAARRQEAVGRTEEAIVTWSVLATLYPESRHWASAMLRAGRLLEEQRDGERYAARFYERLIDRMPESEEAREARGRI